MSPFTYKNNLRNDTWLTIDCGLSVKPHNMFFVIFLLFFVNDSCVILKTLVVFIGTRYALILPLTLDVFLCCIKTPNGIDDRDVIRVYTVVISLSRQNENSGSVSRQIENSGKMYYSSPLKLFVFSLECNTS